MKLTPKHLKIFRSHYAITQAQAAHLFGTTKRQWWRWEQEVDPIPDIMYKQLVNKINRLNAALAYRAKYCHWCGKKVEAAKRHGWHTCPYCGRQFSRKMKTRILEVLPVKKLPLRRLNND